MITFIIPTINRPSLKNSLESLINQTKSNWKAIVLFDNVPDFKEVVRDKRITYINVEKKGSLDENNHGMAGLLRNVGLDLAKDARIIGFLDDDDILEPKYIENINPNYDINVFRMRWYNNIILPQGNDIRCGNVGISFCFKNNQSARFKNNSSFEDYEFLKALIDELKYSYLVNDYIGYTVRGKHVR